jgi:chemotaxis protein MotB
MGKGRKRGNSDGASADTTGWMVTFGDLLMLLLTFFVLLLTMSSMDVKSLQTMLSIFQGASGPLDPSELKAIKRSRSLEGGVGALEMTALKALTLMKDMRKKVGMPQGKTGALVTSVKMLEDFFASEDDDEREQILIGLESILQFSEDDRGIVLSFEANLLFAPGEAEIKPEFASILDVVAGILRVATNDVLVMGHTDNSPIRSKRYRSNWELSLYRALNVHKYLVEDKGMSPERFGVGGYGDTNPKYPNDSREGREKNRRVEIILRKT